MEILYYIGFSLFVLLIFVLGMLWGYVENILDMKSQLMNGALQYNLSEIQVGINEMVAESEVEEKQPCIGFGIPSDDDYDEDYEEEESDDYEEENCRHKNTIGF